ncbi:hypothetical protein K437DRAFT_134234 [Tilletiaria anomala UBC 951]|uniref:RNI-like protein n=1 Tax=Tilletiaria anomala (strain ATCC 24038 / CBS 436.72 / UBC 951) TaxID=1037660 RepID=A0A066WPQ5_TILAU|nr:uncharacterized protein K437DRAFT_134234 [Tilletiaria anomala UBC 951]KDN52974.1 hypothetical protein K437DRAFT_134234 [Tilletiaria anomala UBC 951]
MLQEVKSVVTQQPLHSLSLASCNLEASCLRPLASYIEGNGTLRELHLQGNSLLTDPPLAGLFARSVRHSVLGILNLSTNRMDDRNEAFDVFLLNLNSVTLQTLSLSQLIKDGYVEEQYATADGTIQTKRRSLGIKAARTLALFIRRSLQTQVCASSSAREASKARSFPPYAGCPNLTLLKLNANSFGQGGVSLITAAHCGDSSWHEITPRLNQRLDRPGAHFASSLEPRADWMLYGSRHFLLVNLYACESMTEDHVVFEDILAVVRHGHMALENGQERSDWSAANAILTEHPCRGVQDTGSVRFEAQALERVLEALACYNETKGHPLNNLLKPLHPSITRCTQIAAFSVLGVARVLGCNVSSAATADGSPPWWLHLPPELKIAILRQVASQSRIEYDHEYPRFFSERQLLAVLSFASDARTIGYGRTNEALIATLRVKEEEGLVKEGRLQPGILGTPIWSFVEAARRSPPRNWPAELAHMQRDLSSDTWSTSRSRHAEAAAFLDITETLMCRE